MTVSAFQTPVDIANRALQRVGARRITAFTDDSKSATETSFVYDKLREAELRRNVWTFATRRTVLRPLDPTMQELVATAYDATKSYPIGSIVSFTDGFWYVTRQPTPAGNEPDTSPTYWGRYFGPLIVQQWGNPVQGGPSFWASGTTYASGSLVIGSDGNEYSSLASGNIGHNPVGDGGVHWQLVGVAPTATGYFAGELVYYPVGPAPGVYVSLQDNNISNPTVVPPWNSSTIYQAGDTATGSDAAVYQCKVDLNINIDPTTDAGVHWETTPVTNQAGQKYGQAWLKTNATCKAFQFIYSAGSGPSTQTETRNVYILPNGFQREAPQDPKAGATSWLGAPHGLQYNDWTFQDGYFTTREVQPISLRFVADISDVTEMDVMFCEGLACRVGLEVCETLTQSTSKLSALIGEYNKFMGEARMVNGIEQGPTEAPEDDYITARW